MADTKIDPKNGNLVTGRKSTKRQLIKPESIKAVCFDSSPKSEDIATEYVDDDVKKEMIPIDHESPSEWINRRFDELSKKYKGKFIAVNDKGFVAAGSTYTILINKIKRKRLNPAKMTVIYFHEGLTI